MKAKVLLLTAALSTTLLVGCSNQETDKTEDKPSTQTEETTDATTSASIVDSAEAFEKAISKEGTWIIATLNDLTIDKELVLDGEFKNGKKDDAGNEIIQRKIGLYTQDADHNVTDRFSLTAPKLTIKSPNAKIQSGTFIGDIYVSAENFELKDTKVEGNVYFTTEEAESTFIIDEASSISGVKELKK